MATWLNVIMCCFVHFFLADIVKGVIMLVLAEDGA
jgi:hypothetical protein